MVGIGREMEGETSGDHDDHTGKEFSDGMWNLWCLFRGLWIEGEWLVCFLMLLSLLDY